MQLLEVEMASGRLVQLTRLYLLPTLEWRYPANPEATERNWRELLTKQFGTAELPLIMCDGAADSWVTCLGSFTSQALHSLDHWKDYSFLVVCWFAGPELPSVRELAAAGLAGVDWEAHARDYDAWNM